MRNVGYSPPAARHADAARMILTGSPQRTKLRCEGQSGYLTSLPGVGSFAATRTSAVTQGISGLRRWFQPVNATPDLFLKRSSVRDGCRTRIKYFAAQPSGIRIRRRRGECPGRFGHVSKSLHRSHSCRSPMELDRRHPFTCRIRRCRRLIWRGVSLLRRPSKGLPPVRNSMRIGVPVSLSASRKAFSR
jgi:hypothetical protein